MKLHDRVRHVNSACCCSGDRRWVGTVVWTSNDGVLCDVLWDCLTSGKTVEINRGSERLTTVKVGGYPERFPARLLEPAPPEIRVANLKSEPDALTKPSAVYVGRRNDARHLEPSPLQNKHHISATQDRDMVCRLFASETLEPAIASKKGAVWKELNSLVQRYRSGEPLTLACWCAPERCHADEIAKAVLELAAN